MLSPRQLPNLTQAAVPANGLDVAGEGQDRMGRKASVMVVLPLFVFVAVLMRLSIVYDCN